MTWAVRDRVKDNIACLSPYTYIYIYIYIYLYIKSDGVVSDRWSRNPPG